MGVHIVLCVIIVVSRPSRIGIKDTSVLCIASLYFDFIKPEFITLFRRKVKL